MADIARNSHAGFYLLHSIIRLFVVSEYQKLILGYLLKLYYAFEFASCPAANVLACLATALAGGGTTILGSYCGGTSQKDLCHNNEAIPH